MKTKTYKIKDLETVVIGLGYVGENERTRVVIDAGEVFSEYPQATVGIAVLPPEGGRFPVTVTRDGDLVEWVIKNSVLVHDGEGRFQLTFMNGNEVARSCRGKFRVKESIPDGGTAPDAIQDWIDDANEVLEEAREAAEAGVHPPKIGSSGYWEIWDAAEEQYVSSGVKAQGEQGPAGADGHDGAAGHTPVMSGSKEGKISTITADGVTIATIQDGADADPTQLIDDTAGAGDTDKVLSADKVTGELAQVKTDITEIDNVVYKDVPDHDELINIPLSFNSYGWWTDQRYYDTQDGKKAEVAVNEGEKYDVTGFSTWSFAPYVVIDDNDTILLAGTQSGSGTKVKREATITIPSGGVKLVFSASAADTAWQNACSCKKHNIIYRKESAFVVEVDNQENVTLSWTDGKAYMSNGNALVDNGYSYDMVDVVPGDTYSFMYWSQWTVTYVLFDENDEMISHGEVSDSATWKSYETTIQIPSNGAKLALSITSYRPSDQVTKSYLYHAYKDKVDLQEYMLNVLTQSNVLYGKKWFATGDSFTHGSLVDPDENPIFQSGKYLGKRKTYPYFIGQRNNMTIINDGLSGSTMAEIKSGDSYETTPFCDASRYQSIPEDTDYITLWFGINDANHCNLGTISDSTGATFYGAWNMVLDWIITNRPSAKIGIIITSLSTNTFREATREIAKKWGIPYLDMMGDYQVPVLIGGRETALGLDSDVADARTAHWRIASDNNHPTVAAHRYESTFIEAFLRRL